MIREWRMDPKKKNQHQSLVAHQEGRAQYKETGVSMDCWPLRDDLALSIKITAILCLRNSKMFILQVHARTRLFVAKLLQQKIGSTNVNVRHK